MPSCNPQYVLCGRKDPPSDFFQLIHRGTRTVKITTVQNSLCWQSASSDTCWKASLPRMEATVLHQNPVILTFILNKLVNKISRFLNGRYHAILAGARLEIVHGHQVWWTHKERMWSPSFDHDGMPVDGGDRRGFRRSGPTSVVGWTRTTLTFRTRSGARLAPFEGREGAASAATYTDRPPRDTCISGTSRPTSSASFWTSCPPRGSYVSRSRTGRTGRDVTRV